MNRIHDIQAIVAEKDFLQLTVDGYFHQIQWGDCSPLLAKATQAQREHFDVSPSGYGIHWPDIDEDLAISPLIQHATRSVPLERA